MAKGKRVVVESVPDPAKGRAEALCSAWDGERRIEGNFTFSRLEGRLGMAQDSPLDLPHQFLKARHWFKYQWFVRAIILMRMDFFHYGFSLKSDDGNNERVKKWEKANRKMYRRYAREAWLEWLLQDNVVGLWWEQGGYPPLVFPIEETRLTDTFGMEVLKVRHGLNSEVVQKMPGLSKAQRAALSKPELSLDHNNEVFGFDVLRREGLGRGYGVPGVTPLFTVAPELESLEVGDAQLAAACRNVYEQHKMGYEIKSGIHAGSKANHWSAIRAKEFEKAIKGKSGTIRITTNFDHNVLWPRPDAKCWDAKRYEGGINRIALWSMPLGQMLLGKSLNPFLMTMLKMQGLLEREYMAEHLQTVFVSALGAPESVKVTWSNRCFSDPRIAADLLKNGLQAGPLSQETYLEESGYETEQERERKALEAKLPKGQVTPAFDAHHGPVRDIAGKKPGTKDEG